MFAILIPDIGDTVRLAEPWVGNLSFESRNKPILNLYYELRREDTDSGNRSPVLSVYNKEGELLQKLLEDTVYLKDRFPNVPRAIAHTFPVGTLLTVDRVYIRKGKGMSDYSSVSFYATLPGIKGRKRFWVKLPDVNQLRFDLFFPNKDGANKDLDII